MKRSVVLCVLILLTAACAGDSGTTTSSPEPGTTTLATPDSSTTLGTGETTTSSGETTTTSDRELAPDFALELGDGGTYTLSDGARPVYMVFWAEW